LISQLSFHLKNQLILADLRFFTHRVQRNWREGIIRFGEDVVNQITEMTNVMPEKSSSHFNGPANRLSYYIHDHSHSFRLELFGALAEGEIADLDGCWRTAESSVAGRKVRIDLRGVSVIDSAGRQWLANMARIEGAEFVISPEMSSELPDSVVRLTETATKALSSSWDSRIRALFRSVSGASAPAKQEASATKNLALEAETGQVPIA
jgi:ABC-type transporter Mla MlaB component